ncbi:MAG: hypothetical protein F4Y50_07605 [Dehalococcoidia bacterium]|nr:hypothetical protein [Dehalococcoidia bacterium]
MLWILTMVTRLGEPAVRTPSHWLMARSADQLRLPVSPWRVGLASRRVSQSAARAVWDAATAPPLMQAEVCAVTREATSIMTMRTARIVRVSAIFSGRSPFAGVLVFMVLMSVLYCRFEPVEALVCFVLADDHEGVALLMVRQAHHERIPTTYRTLS